MKLLFISFYFSLSAFALDIKTEKLVAMNGETKSFTDLSKSRYAVILAFGAECPILRKHVPTINRLGKELEKKSVSFFLVNTIASMSDEKIEEERKDFKIVPIIYKNPETKLLKGLGFTTFGEVALIDLKKNEVLYQGAINNQFTFDGTKEKPTENYLEDAIASTLKNESVKNKKTKNFGCEITY